VDSTADRTDTKPASSTAGYTWRGPVSSALALSVIVACFQLQRHVSGPAPLAFVVLLVGVASGLFGTYLLTLRRIHARSGLSDESLLRRYFSGFWLGLTVGVFCGALAGLAFALALVLLGGRDWRLLAAAPLLFAAIERLTGSRIRREFKPYRATGRALVSTAFATAAVLIFLQVTLAAATGGVPRYDSLEMAVDAVRAGATMQGGGPIGAALVTVGAWAAGLKAYALGLIAGSDPSLILGLVMLAVWSAPFLFAVCCFLAAFYVPPREYERILAPLSENAVPPPVPLRRLCFASGIATILVLFVYPLLVVSLDRWLAGNPAIQDTLDRLEVEVERIDDVVVRPGTLEEIEQARHEILLRRTAANARLEAAIDAGFDRMVENVDVYLDWYYSLPAEYARVGTVLAGDPEAYLERKLREKLDTGDPFGRAREEFENALALDAAATEEFDREVADILARNRVEARSDDRGVHVVREVTRTDLSFDPSGGLDPVEARIGIGAGSGAVAGVVGGVIGAKVASKAVASGAVKIGAKALLKVGTGQIAGKAGIGAGAAIGAAAGSVVPGVGTAVGAVVGGVLAGVATGVAIDYGTLKASEYFGAEEHRAALVDAIEEARQETLAALRGGGSQGPADEGAKEERSSSTR
jgi:hypothetical protein